MYSPPRVIAFCGFILTIGYGQNTNPTASQLEAMERFASKPTAQVAWSKEIDRIDTDQAHAVITALGLDDRTQTPQQMRGVRIDLTGANLNDRVYTSEDLLERLIRALDEISNGPPDFHARVLPWDGAVASVREFFASRAVTPFRRLNVSFRIGPVYRSRRAAPAFASQLSIRRHSPPRFHMQERN